MNASMVKKIRDLNAKNSPVRKFIERHVSDVDLDTYTIVYAHAVTRYGTHKEYDLIVVRKMDGVESADNTMVLYNADGVITGTIGWTVACAFRNAYALDNAPNKFVGTVIALTSFTRNHWGMLKHLNRPAKKQTE